MCVILSDLAVARCVRANKFVGRPSEISCVWHSGATVGHRTCDQEVASSIPGQGAAEARQVFSHQFASTPTVFVAPYGDVKQSAVPLLVRNQLLITETLDDDGLATAGRSNRTSDDWNPSAPSARVGCPSSGHLPPRHLPPHKSQSSSSSSSSFYLPNNCSLILYC